MVRKTLNRKNNFKELLVSRAPTNSKGHTFIKNRTKSGPWTLEKTNPMSNFTVLVKNKFLINSRVMILNMTVVS